MNGYAKALTQSASAGVSTLARRDEIQAKAAQVKLQKNTAEAMGEPDVIAGQVAALQAQNKQIVAKQEESATYQTFDMYSATGNPKAFNQLLETNPGLRNKWLNVASIQRLDPETDSAILNEKGIKPEQYNQFKHLKVVMPNGKELLFDVGEMMKGTRYLSMARSRDTESAIKEKELLGKSDKEYSPSEAGKFAQDYEKYGQGTAEEGFGKYATNKFVGNAGGQLEAATQAELDLDKLFSGSFASSYTGSAEDKLKANPIIRRIEVLGKAKLDGKDRTDLKGIGRLIALGDIVTDKVSPEAVGLLDNALGGAKSYYSNDMSNADVESFRSAYSAYRNTTRNALYGATLTPGEMAAFDQEFGTLSQKFPAVIAQFKTSILQIKAKLSSIANLNNPYVTTYYLGKSQDDVDEMLVRLDERLELMSEYEPGGKYHKDTGGYMNNRRRLRQDAGIKEELPVVPDKQVADPTIDKAPPLVDTKTAGGQLPPAQTPADDKAVMDAFKESQTPTQTYPADWRDGWRTK